MAFLNSTIGPTPKKKKNIIIIIIIKKKKINKGCIAAFSNATIGPNKKNKSKEKEEVQNAKLTL